MNILEEFCKVILAKTRDDVIDREFGILEGKTLGHVNNELHKLVQDFSEKQKNTLKKIIIDSVDSTLHELLYNFDENNTFSITAYDNGDLLNLRDHHGENLVGEFLDAIDDYGKYNTPYSIVIEKEPIEKCKNDFS